MSTITLFVRNIPTGTTVPEIRDYVESGVSWVIRMKAGFKFKILRVQILTTVYGKTMEQDFHGLVTITPDHVAEDIIKKLRFKYLRGQRVLVRKYYERNASNDRRSRHGKADSDFHRNRRVRDRRVHVPLDYETRRLKNNTRKLT